MLHPKGVPFWVPGMGKRSPFQDGGMGKGSLYPSAGTRFLVHILHNIRKCQSRDSVIKRVWKLLIYVYNWKVCEMGANFIIISIVKIITSSVITVIIANIIIYSSSLPLRIRTNWSHQFAKLSTTTLIWAKQWKKNSKRKTPEKKTKKHPNNYKRTRKKMELNSQTELQINPRPC